MPSRIGKKEISRNRYLNVRWKFALQIKVKEHFFVVRIKV